MAPEEDRRRCISECVEEITRWNPRSDRAAAKMEPIGRDLRDRNLKLLTADKEGFFVLLTEGQYEEKASAAVAKNFKQANVKTQKVKEQAKKLLQTPKWSPSLKKTGDAVTPHTYLEAFE
ncbi:hypothetical protein HPB50_026521 [Hyalomma asiaticum]|uniref:Uncharacterized protein n=1 Tax=Hyalomma asiaticum TaxID=266040 RepID=A0ACB7S3L1_HYAAI|nr:hypothetical protein HPB50_026521 [Hyalomma asiaticum]